MLGVWYPSSLLDKAVPPLDVYAVILITILACVAIARLGRR